MVLTEPVLKVSGVVSNNEYEFQIIKSEGLHIGGYASIEIVDKQNDLITLEALDEAVKKFMTRPKYRNVMTNHSNVQVGEVVKEYRDVSGRLWKTEVDDVGFFVVIKLREDIEKAKEVGREIRKGNLRSFSIGGQALEKRKKTNEELGGYNEISKLELHEVTICEKGINPEAKFDILKQDVNNMSEIDNAIQELNMLLKEIKKDYDPDAAEARLAAAGQPIERNVGATGQRDVESVVPAEKRAEAVRTAGSQRLENVEHVLVDPETEAGPDEEEAEMFFEEEDMENLDSTNKGENMTQNVEKEEYLDAEEEEGDDLELTDADEELKGKRDLAYGSDLTDEAGLEVVEGGKPRNKNDQISVPNVISKKVWGGETTGLDLSAENLEKAYAEFKAEQMEKLAYEDIKHSFENRFNTELERKSDAIDRNSYDARIEVNQLKKQFGELLDTLKDDSETIIRKNVAAQGLSPDFKVPSYDEIADMDWNEVHLAAQRLSEKAGF